MIGAIASPVLSLAADSSSLSTTGEYVQACGQKTIPNVCYERFAFGKVMGNMSSKYPKNCAPDFASETVKGNKAKNAEMVTKVVEWLKNHPEYSDKDVSDGLAAGISAVYPCP